MKKLIQALTGTLDVIEQEIASHIAASKALSERAANLKTLKGVGPITAATLPGELPELGRLSGKEIAALVGLAPRTRESGKTSWRATTGHGRPGVRAVLFNAARCAIRHNAHLKAFYQRLVTDNGRPGKVALTAIMRKMLVTLNAIARENKPWRLAQNLTYQHGRWPGQRTIRLCRIGLAGHDAFLGYQSKLKRFQFIRWRTSSALLAPFGDEVVELLR